MSDLPGLLAIAANNTASVVEIQPETLAVLLYALGKIDNYKSWRDHWNEYISDADIELIHELVDLAADNIMRPLVIPEHIYPKTFMAFGHQAKMVSGGTLQHIFFNNMQFAHYTRVVTPYINNEYEIELLLAAGNWRINWMVTSSSSSGQVRFRVNGVDTTYFADWYSATQTPNLITSNNTLIEIGTDGNHKISWKSTAKNASSSNYNFWLQAVWGTWESAL